MYDLRIIQALSGDAYFPGQHQQGGQGNANTEQKNAHEANSEGKGEVPAVEALVAHVQHPIPMLPPSLQLSSHIGKEWMTCLRRLRSRHDWRDPCMKSAQLTWRQSQLTWRQSQLTWCQSQLTWCQSQRWAHPQSRSYTELQLHKGKA